MPNRTPFPVCLALAGLACGPDTKDSAGDAPAVGDPSTDTHSPQTPPTAPEISIHPAAPVTGDDLSFRVDTPPADADGDALTWFVAWFVDGVPATGWDELVPAEETRKGQVWEVRATVTDGTYTSDTDIAVVVIGNTPPVAQVTLSPENPTTVDRLRVSTSSIDPDEGDVVGYRISWQVDGVDAGITGLDVDPSVTVEGELWTVTVTPVDPDGSGEPVSTAVTIENSLPIVERLEISPGDPSTRQDVEADFEGSDADPADVLTPVFEWTVDGRVVGTDSSLSSSLYERGQELGLSVALHDGSVQGPVRFAEPVVVRNSLPSVLGVDIDPPAPGVTDEVTCIPRGWSDADGDAEGYQYQWSLDGVAGPATDAWSLSGGSAAAGQTLTCTVIPDDGIDAGAPATVSVTLRDG